MGRNAASVKSRFFFKLQIFFGEGIPCRRDTKHKPRRGYDFGAGGEELFDALDVGGNVHADGVVVGFDHAM
jgi:hypothetical protein